MHCAAHSYHGSDGKRREETERVAMRTKRILEPPLMEPPLMEPPMIEPPMMESERASATRRRRTRYTPLPGIMENAVYEALPRALRCAMWRLRRVALPRLLRPAWWTICRSLRLRYSDRLTRRRPVSSQSETSSLLCRTFSLSKRCR